MNYLGVVLMLREAGFSEPRRGGNWWLNQAERLAAELTYDRETGVYSFRVEPMV